MPPRAKSKPTEPDDAASGANGSSAGSGGLRLVIVESPAKARTIAGYLGDGYLVESSIGHIRDLPRNAADVPAAVKSQPWSRLGVDVDNGFEPLYIVTADKKAQVAKLKALLKDASELYLATDEDREGEAIAWHLLQTLKPRVPVRRMVFHEITPQAIRQAVDNPREIDDRLVDAQETRRILDRLYGYEVSPVLWKKVMPRLSAGRVQSVATKILVEREKARMAFRAAGYWDIEGVFTASSDETIPLPATLVSVGGARVATGRDFSSTGQLTTANVRQLDESAAGALVAGLTGAGFAVTSVEERPYRRSPVRAVHDQHAPAGGRAQAALLQPAHDADRAAAVRERLHHLYAYRLDLAVRDGDRRGPHPGPPAVRPRVRAGAAAQLHPQGEERAGGPRGDPPGGGLVPHAGPGRQPAQRRRVPALRADLAAHRRQPDGRRDRHERHRAACGDGRLRARTRAARPSSRPPARSSPSPVSFGPTSKAATTPTPNSKTASGACRPCTRATGSRPVS